MTEDIRPVNLFVVGAMKAGTTSFVELLNSHSDIYLSPIKEPHYFIDGLPKFIYEPSRFHSEEKYFTAAFPEPMHICSLEKRENYDKLFSLAANERYLLDASTAHLAKPGTARRISQYNPNAKIIIITRAPLERMYSHYKMRCGLSSELRDFETVAKEEIALYNSGDLPWASYLAMSLYDTGIGEYREQFESVEVISFEGLLEDAEQTLSIVSKFLEIEPFQQLELPRTNLTRKLKFQKLFFFLRHLGLKDYFSKLFGSRFKQKVFKAVSSGEKQQMELSDETRQQLNAIFEKGSNL